MEPTSSVQPSRTYPPPAAAEPFWPAQTTILAAIALQLLLPKRLTAGPTWLIPSLEGALLIGMSFATPRQLEHEHRLRRRVALGLTAFVSAANVLLAELTHLLLHHNVSDGRELIVAGVLIWLTNFLIFALWYWEIDRADPAGVRPDTTGLHSSCSRRWPTIASSPARGVPSSSTTCTR